MKIKEPTNSNQLALFSLISKMPKSWLAIIAIALLLLVGSNLISIYYGIHLHKTGQSISLNQWLSGIVNEKFSIVPNYIDGLAADPERLDIDVKFKNLQKLEFKRQEGLQNGILNPAADDWVSAQINHNGEKYRADIRLKGDLPDHWKVEGKWSFKVKLKGENTLFGMKRFAIQDPRTRYFLNEWYLHKMLAHMGLIHLRYDFVEIAINGDKRPIMAIEENFEKRLIENNQYREGPILRFERSFYWDDKPGMQPSFMGASVEGYGNINEPENEVLTEQFMYGKNLLELFRAGELPGSKVFDIGKMAKLIAITDLIGHYHTLGVDNIRLYYNPITSLIEPIGYDFNLIKSLNQEGMLIERTTIGKDQPFDTEWWWNNLFNEPEFYQAYIQILEQISNPEFLDNFFEETNSEYEEKLRILHKSYPWYNFKSKEILYANQDYIRGFLNPTKGIQAYFKSQNLEDGNMDFEICNIHTLPLEITGVSYVDQFKLIPDQPTVIEPSAKDLPLPYQTFSVKLPREELLHDTIVAALEINYKVKGTSSELKTYILPWNHLDSAFSRQDFMRLNPNFQDFDLVSVDHGNNLILLQPGNWVLDRHLIIPKGYKVKAGPGTQIDLVNSSKILSYSPVEFIGREDNPVRIFSSDSSGQGLLVITADLTSELYYTEFEGLTNPKQGGWSLPSAVTFYESPVNIDRCKFIGNHCEDGLNIFRSSFTLVNSTFLNTQADAFDGDFCTGKIEETKFINCGNDAIDVSGSRITVNNVAVDGAGDKGLSAGENSTMDVKNITLTKTEIAVASKDKSTINLDQVKITNSRIAFTAFQKKPEFTLAEIYAQNVTMDQSPEIPFLIEEESMLFIDGEKIPPSRQNVKEILYGVEFGKSSR